MNTDIANKGMDPYQAAKAGIKRIRQPQWPEGHFVYIEKSYEPPRLWWCFINAPNMRPHPIFLYMLQGDMWVDYEVSFPTSAVIDANTHDAAKELTE